MAFNSNFVRSMRAAKNTTAKIKHASNFKNLPFVGLNELLDGEYKIRLWPSDPNKNAWGYLFYKTHTLLNHEGKPMGGLSLARPSHQCPRSSNWDPIPLHWEDDLGVVVEDPSPEDCESLHPVYKVRCWGCETTGQVAEAEIDVPNLPEELQKFLKDLDGDEQTHFPCTITMEIASQVKEKREKRDGSFEEATVTDYKPCSTAKFHCDLSLKEGSVLKDLRGYIEECPDCSHLLLGRWFKLTKQNEGKGVGGYKLTMGPNPSQAGFELPPGMYPNYTNWGQPKGKPSKRFKYEDVEAVGSDSRGFWVKPLEQLGIVLSDEVDIPF